MPRVPSPNSGDGAGILMQIPDAFLRAVAGEAGFELPAARAYAVGTAFLPGDDEAVAKTRTLIEEIAAEEGLSVLGWRDVPTQPDCLGTTALGVMPQFAQLFVTASGQRLQRHGAGADGLLPAPPRREGDRRLLPVALVAHPGLQGHAHHRAARRVLPRPARRADRLGPVRRPLAVLDQHLPELAALAPVPLHRPQRRDQHRDGQPQLDAGPRGAARLRPDPGRPRAALPDLHARRVRLGVVRRGARAAAHGRPLAAARGADDDPGGVGEPHRDGSRPPGVLRVPLHDDGAVGRPRLRGLHRRRPGRRGARPQRPAPLALLGDRRRAGRAGLRGRRPRPRPGDDRAQGPAAAGPDVPDRHQ